MNIGYPDTLNRKKISSPLYQIGPPGNTYKVGDAMDQDDFEQMRSASGDFHHGDIIQNASKIKKDKKGQYITHDYGYSDEVPDTIRPPRGRKFKKFTGKDVYSKEEQKKLYFPNRTK